jgi:NifU-like protein involved in Fe-S cluster formation
MLGLATSLSDFPLSADLPLRGSARSKSCGSALELGLALDSDGRISGIGLQAQACAVGQAAAALFARHATGCNSRAIANAERSLGRWLGEGGPLPDWPGLSIIAKARDYPGRHGAILLAWNAALVALSSHPVTG